MRQAHKAGEKMLVDYAGQTVPVMDPMTGEVRPAQIFLAVLGASNYTYAEAVFRQSLPDWIGSHIRGFAFFGGVTALIVPDKQEVRGNQGLPRRTGYQPHLPGTG